MATLEPGGFDDWFVLMDGIDYVSDASVEGTAEQWRDMLDALENGRATHHKRCAVIFRDGAAHFWVSTQLDGQVPR